MIFNNIQIYFIRVPIIADWLLVFNGRPVLYAILFSEHFNTYLSTNHFIIINFFFSF